MVNIKACIFDLDGVIVDTAKYHFLAWEKIADQLGIHFTEKDNEALKGVSRMTSLNIILSLGKKEFTASQKQALAEEKNNLYLSYVQHMTEEEILPGVKKFLENLKSNNIKIALGSASKNARLILDKIQLTTYFDAIIDGNLITAAKPDPQVFLKAASLLNVLPREAVVFEDAEVGIEASVRGGFYCVGIGDKQQLGKANLVIKNFDHFSISDLIKNISDQ
jgi:beta-phosphoglucomutase